jgi:polar amino acid transport system substrate-binding protein
MPYWGRMRPDGRTRPCIGVAAVIFGACALVNPTQADDLVPTGTLRATFIATNPVQATVDPATGDVRGPANDLARELGRRLSVPVKVTPAMGVNGVLNDVKNGEADIGFLAYDPDRAVEVDFSQPYSIGQNTFIVLDTSRLKSVADVDQPGMVLGATQGDAGELFLTRTLKNAELKRNRDGMDNALKMLRSGEIQAYGTNRQRLHELAGHNPGLRLLPDNFYGVEQSIIVKKGNKALLDVVEKFLDEARNSRFLASVIERSGLVGVDVAPPRRQQTR